ncbi:MAG: NADH:ubiquinone reductase (Na(+)-transporting) subunit B [Parabacteroides sp.]|uniref:Na(+)-translocating NADH-quinone reductase subunit B n=1 Tax=Parabacteroides faecalis TaxID=2924040 RepID=A0ABT0C0A2_9BACT|nr:NADH:ubiquinone reductase (Na(+)-transporting) subunit B [Parabacteroides faecalis]MBS7343138.1 NADH:ubiquinone reductase (Na(+)-transporting) subunit B [Parabacteroides sp.]MDY5621903.1 NADH:ubiquinone reductase (Na(+)-transporting) subunit B [Bacteroidales bacterium]MCI7285272.1 NADH:ubiquinone reductase (Na(+)-transporting) subunit B [Parabacteroides sp.]MCI7357030.1 NADH:ubiquinone reductase (Na(+)-transporting) subunit B [Parabacteroides sp.]MCI7707480.1 NADH:ubiquinone reductase (Na(+
MKALRNYLDKIKPNFEEGGKLAMFRSVFDGFETFLFVPNTTSKTGVHIHDSIDSKRTMTVVIIALLPALLFGMYNVGYQHNLAVGSDPGFWMTFIFGFLAVLPKIIVSYVVGLGIEFMVAQWKKEEIQEGFLVSGILIPMIVPVDTPLWMIAVATAFAVIFAKEVFGGTGYNVFNVALVTRAFLFFAYPAAMSGDQVFVRTSDTFGLGAGQVVDGFSGATPLGQIAIAGKEMIGNFHVVDVLGNQISTWDYFVGLIPGSIGETSVIAILIGAVILLVTGIASWKTMFSVFVGGAAMTAIFNMIGTTVVMTVSPVDHLFLGGFAFGAVFMATDPVTSARTETGKYIYGLLVGAMAIIIRVLNPGYPEGMMLAILLMNVFAPLIDYYVVEANINRRINRVKLNK